MQQMVDRFQEVIRPRLTASVLRTRALCLVFFGLVMVGCATSPTGRTQLMLVSEATAISASRQAYLAEMQRLEKEGKLSEDAAMARWVGDITGRLVAQAIRMRPDAGRWDWSVAIIEDPDTVNAWCMAGGRMAVYTGLLRKLDPTEDEFAQVMGHEIAHALANHTAEKMSVAMASQIGIIAVGVASDDPRLTAAAAVAAKAALSMPLSPAGLPSPLLSIWFGLGISVQLSTSSRLSHPNQANGMPQPPRNSTEAMRANTPAVANSAMKKIRNRKPVYSVM